MVLAVTRGQGTNVVNVKGYGDLHAPPQLQPGMSSGAPRNIRK